MLNEDLVQQTYIILSLAEQEANTIDHLHNIPTTVTTHQLNPQEIQVHFQEEIQTLTVLNRRMVQETQQIQKNVSGGIRGIEQELARITLTARTFKTHRPEGLGSASSSAAVPEIMRQSTQFVADVQTMSRQLTHIAQEIRTGIVSFQLDATDTAQKPPVQSGRPVPSNPLISNHL